MSNLLISKATKKSWKLLYSAYRAYNRNQRKLNLATHEWRESHYNEELEVVMNRYGSLSYELHSKWLDALEVVWDVTNSRTKLSIQPDILCRYAFENDPLSKFSPHEKLRARLYAYKADKYEANYDIYIDSKDGHSFFRSYNIAVKVEESLQLTEAEKNALWEYKQQKIDIDYGLSAYQLIDLVQRNEFGYGILGTHWRGYEKERKLP